MTDRERAEAYVKRHRALLCWHGLFGWPVLRDITWQLEARRRVEGS